MNLHTKFLLSQLLTLAAEGGFREPLIASPRPESLNEKYSIEALNKAEAKRARKKLRREGK